MNLFPHFVPRGKVYRPKTGTLQDDMWYLMKRCHGIVLCLMVIVVLAPRHAAAAPDSINFANKGKAQCVIVVPAGAMAENVVFPRRHVDYVERIAEIKRQLLRDSVRDLAHYLGKIAGAEFEVVESRPLVDQRNPIYVGKRAKQIFGPVGITKSGAFGFRVVADPKRGIGLYGESEHGTSYAIYELLHRLGCRWYMPTDLGEVIPRRPTLNMPSMDDKLMPATEYRDMTQGGADWKRRNRFTTTGKRLGRLPGRIGNGVGYDGTRVTVSAGHNMLWRLIPEESGLRGRAFGWTDPKLADVMSQTMLGELDTHFAEVLAAGIPVRYRLNMPDGQFPTEDPEERKHDPAPRVWEKAAGRWSITDRLILLTNRILERVTKVHPNVSVETLGYVNHSSPPARYKPHPHITWTIAPIDFNRHHPMDWPDHVNEYWLRDMVQGWASQNVSLGAYWYGMNLAELSAPCPFIAKWGTDIRILLENNLVAWSPETMNGWDSMLPGYYLSARMTFDAKETPEEILDDLWTRFYGPAAKPMASYWTGIDKAYLDAREYAGSPYGYLNIFTPEVMKSGRADLVAALKSAGKSDGAFFRRVKLIDESFGLFEQFMAMRNDWADGKLAQLDTDYEVWRTALLAMVERYHDPADKTYVQGRHGNPRWNDNMVRPGYSAGTRMERNFVRLGPPMLEWKWKHNPGPEKDSHPWTATVYDDKNWPAMHVIRDTWSSIGHHLSMTDEASGKSGRMAYRASQKVGTFPKGKKAFLWIGMTDGRAKVFVNGQLIKYVVPEKTKKHEAGTVLDAFDGYCKPASFDITGPLKSGENQITILAERHVLNELGSGGLMGPIVLYREK